jgi:hypothetical protein
MSEKVLKVLANCPQGLTEPQKAQARENIGAQVSLVEGDHIHIDGNRISADGATVDQVFDGASENAQSGVAIQAELENKQDKLTEGTGIHIDENNVISADIPDFPEIVTLQHTQGQDTETPVEKLRLDIDFGTIMADNAEIGLMAPLPTVADEGKYLKVNGDVLTYGTVDDKTFIATYNVTTWAEVKAAYDAGKAIILVGANFGSNVHTQMTLYNYSTTSGQSEKFMFAPTVTPRVAAYIKYYATLDQNTGWSKDYFSNTAPTKCGGIFQLAGDETTYNLVEHRGWSCNEIYNFDVKFFSSPNACNIYIGYVSGNQSLKVDVIGTRRNVRNDLKAQIDATTTVQTYVRDIDAWSRIVLVDQPLTSANPRIDLATLGPQEQSNYNYDIYWDLDIIVHQWGVTGSTSPCYHLHIEKYGDPDGGHSYLFGTLAGTDLY